jgi:hypothetical protein
MRKKILLLSGVLALAGTIAVAVVLGIAGVGKAASTNTCQLVGPTPGTPNCLTVTVLPFQLTAGGTGVVIVKFVNQGSATATHPTITVDLGANATAVSARPNPACPASPSGNTVTCNLPNVPGFGTAKVSVSFTTTLTAPATLSDIEATIAYAEGNTNTGSPSNDTFTAKGNPISIVDGDAQKSTCVSTAGTVGLSASRAGQSTTIDTITSVANDLPCTPLSAAVTPKDPNLTCGTTTCNSQVSAVFLPVSATVTVLIPLSSLPNGTTDKKFVLYWFSDTSPVGIALKSCPTIAETTNACIQSQTTVTIAGVKYIKDVLTFQGTNIDPKVAG